MTLRGGDHESPGEHVHPTREDPIAAALSEGIGGPRGHRAATGHRIVTPVGLVMLLAAATFALGMVSKQPCYESTWTDSDTRYAAMCYSDLPYLYAGRGFAELAWPYSDDEQTRTRYEVMEYPVGISYWAWATGRLAYAANGSPDLDPRYASSADSLFGRLDVQREIRGFVIINALGFALITIAAAWLLTRVNPRRPWDAALFAASPALAATAMINWDLLAVGLVAAALWSWARDRPKLTGILIGLGAAVKLYPLFLLGGVLVICLRRRKFADFAWAAGLAAVTWAAVNAPAYLSSGEAWRVFWTFNSERAADLGSIWLVITQAGDVTIEASTINTASWVFFIAWCAGVFALGMFAPTTPRLAQLGFLIVAGFLLINKVYSPQYVLWLLPLAVLAHPRLRDQIIWQGAELLYFASVWWYLGGYLTAPGEGDAGFYWVAIILRMAAELYLVVMVVIAMLSPHRDLVHRAELTRSEPPRAAQSSLS